MFKGRIEKLFLKALMWGCLIFLLAVAVFLAGATWEIRQKERLAQQEKMLAEGQYNEVSERYESLREQLSRLSDERGIEEELRRRFPVAREGEEVVILVDAPSAVRDTVHEAPQGLWGRVKQWFGF